MARTKQLPTADELFELFQSLPLADKIQLYKDIQKHLEEAKKQAQSVQNQLSEVVKEKN